METMTSPLRTPYLTVDQTDFAIEFLAPCFLLKRKNEIV